MGVSTATTGFYNRAADIYGVDDLVTLKMPRQRFNFNVDFVIEEGINLGRAEIIRQSPTFERVVSVTMPDYTYNVAQFNQYNRPRNVPTRLEITPCTIQFYDTRDNLFQDLMVSYAAHYFHGHNLSDSNVDAYDTITSGFQSGVFGTKAIPASQRYFFKRIRVTTIDAREGASITAARSIIMYNCTMTDVNHDTVAYSDSQPVMWTARFQPEHVNIESL